MTERHSTSVGSHEVGHGSSGNGRHEESPGRSRWLLVAAALLLQFAIGAVYAWSVFGGALEEADSWQLTSVVPASSRSSAAPSTPSAS